MILGATNRTATGAKPDTASWLQALGMACQVTSEWRVALAPPAMTFDQDARRMEGGAARRRKDDGHPIMGSERLFNRHLWS